jgi:hypothetical protein
MERRKQIILHPWLIGLAAGLFLTAGGARALAAEPPYEKSDEFQKGKEEFGKNKPPVSVDLGREKSKPPETPARLRGKTLGGFGGPTLNYLQMDMGAFDPLTHDRGLDRFDDAIYLVGGFGAGRIGNLRIGGMGFGAEQKVSRAERKAGVSLACGGLALEYQADLHPRAAVIAGAMLGGGNIRLSAKGPDVAGGDWDKTESFLAAYPYLGLSVKVLPFLRLEAGYGWLFFDYSPGGADYRPGPGVKAVHGSLNGGGSAQARLLFGYETKMKEEK